MREKEKGMRRREETRNHILGKGQELENQKRKSRKKNPAVAKHTFGAVPHPRG